MPTFYFHLSYLGCSHLLTIVNKVAVNIGIEVSGSQLSIPLGCVARNRIAGSYSNSGFNSFFFFLSFCYFFGPLPRHMEVPRLGVQSELQPPAYTRATATRDPSRVCNLHHSSRQRRILNPLSKGRDRTRNLMVPSRIR